MKPQLTFEKLSDEDFSFEAFRGKIFKNLNTYKLVNWPLDGETEALYADDVFVT